MNLTKFQDIIAGKNSTIKFGNLDPTSLREFYYRMFLQGDMYEIKITSHAFIASFDDDDSSSLCGYITRNIDSLTEYQGEITNYSESEHDLLVKMQNEDYDGFAEFLTTQLDPVWQKLKAGDWWDIHKLGAENLRIVKAVAGDDEHAKQLFAKGFDYDDVPPTIYAFMRDYAIQLSVVTKNFSEKNINDIVDEFVDSFGDDLNITAADLRSDLEIYLKRDLEMRGIKFSKMVNSKFQQLSRII